MRSALTLRGMALAGLLLLAAARTGVAEDDPLRDPLAFERTVIGVIERAAPATVGLRVGGSSGSGVVVSPDGLILTAGHVIGRPGQDVTVMFPDGTRTRAVSLGVNERRDSGMARIVEPPAELPWMPMAAEDSLEVGDWCITTGHPGGFDEERPLVARIGRVQSTRGRFLHTDCPIIYGDSGGPLFDLEGQVIGIHSRIQNDVSGNFHVPLSAFRTGWRRLERGETGSARGAKFGVLRTQEVDAGLRLDRLLLGRPAQRAGLAEGDVLVRFGGERVDDLEDLKMVLEDRDPGDLVEVEVRRDGGMERFWVVLEGEQRFDEKEGEG